MASSKLNLIARESSTIGEGDYITYEGVNYHQSIFGSLTFDVNLTELSECFSQEESSGDQWVGQIPSALERTLSMHNANHNHFRPIGQPEKVTTAHGVATLCESRYGKNTLSLFGSNRTFSEIDIVIVREPFSEYALLVGLPEQEANEFNCFESEGFGLDIHLGAERFDSVINSISNNSSSIQITIELTYLPSLFGEAQISDDIGRNYKYLESQEHLTMMDNPSDRIKRAGLINPAPFKLTVTRQI